MAIKKFAMNDHNSGHFSASFLKKQQQQNLCSSVFFNFNQQKCAPMSYMAESLRLRLCPIFLSSTQSTKLKKIVNILLSFFFLMLPYLFIFCPSFSPYLEKLLLNKYSTPELFDPTLSLPLLAQS